MQTAKPALQPACDQGPTPSPTRGGARRWQTSFIHAKESFESTRERVEVRLP